MTEIAVSARAETYVAVRRRLGGANRIVLTTHVQPDGDGIGSEVALARFLRGRGKEVTILNPHRTPRRFRFLEPDPPIVPFEPEVAEAALTSADLLAVLDISVPERLGRLEPYVERIAPDIVIIDHHAGPARIPGLELRDSGAAATAEIVYRLLTEWAEDLTPETVTALYAAIAYDTGGFRYSNTSARTHEIAADLVRRGADIGAVSRNVFESLSRGRVRLAARVLGEFELEAGGRIAWAGVTRGLMKDAGAEPEDVEGLVEWLRAVEGVEVAILFKEVGEGATKVSLRSVGPVDVQGFAARFGGGGHRNASGIFLEAPMEEAIRRVLPEAVKAFESPTPDRGVE